MTIPIVPRGELRPGVRRGGPQAVTAASSGELGAEARRPDPQAGAHPLPATASPFPRPPHPCHHWHCLRLVQVICAQPLQRQA